MAYFAAGLQMSFPHTVLQFWHRVDFGRDPKSQLCKWVAMRSIWEALQQRLFGFPPSLSVLCYIAAFHLDESPSRARPHPVREAGEWLSRRLRPRSSSHRFATWIQLLRGAWRPSAHTGRAHFPHDIYGSNHIGVLCLDGSSDHLSSGKSRQLSVH